MIVRVTFADDTVVLFGNSYKPWWMQFEEYAWRFRAELPRSVKSVESSHSEWVAWGGLKWCAESEFQKELNREGRQENEPDNSNARQYAKMKFHQNGRAYRRVRDALQALPSVA